MSSIPPPGDDRTFHEPRPEAAAGSSFDPLANHLRTSALVDDFVDGRRHRAALDAAEIRTLAAASRSAHLAVFGEGVEQLRRRELAQRSLVAELATSTGVSEWSVTRLLGEAVDLCERFAAGVDALAAGAISRQHLSVIHDAGITIFDDDNRAAFLEAALARASETTPGRLTPIVRVLADRYLEQTLDERHEAASERRDVTVTDLADGMAALNTTLPAALAHGIYDRLTQQARSVIDARDCSGAGEGPDTGASTGEADTRTMAQLRADILTDVLLTAAPDGCVAGSGLGAISATVQVTIPVLTMTGQSGEPCLLAGYGPIDSATARELAGWATGWERVMTSPLNGEVLSVDRYRPSSRLKRFLRARDEHCRFPGCRKAVWRCDMDHTIPAAEGGPTCATNLANLCRRHHTLKGNTAWTVRQVKAGVLEWTSPSGRAHTDTPEPIVRFVPNDDLLARRKFVREPWLDPPDGERAPF